MFAAFNVCTTHHTCTLHTTDLKILYTSLCTMYNYVHSSARYKPLCTQALAPGLRSGTHPRGNTALANTFVWYCTTINCHYSTALKYTVITLLWQYAGITLLHYTTLYLLYCTTLHFHLYNALHYTVITLLNYTTLNSMR